MPRPPRQPAEAWVRVRVRVRVRVWVIGLRVLTLNAVLDALHGLDAVLGAWRQLHFWHPSAGSRLRSASHLVDLHLELSWLHVPITPSDVYGAAVSRRSAGGEQREPAAVLVARVLTHRVLRLVALACVWVRARLRASVRVKSRVV